MLQGLGIEAEPVLANLVSDDGLDQRLPNPDVFNHVLVRARLNDTLTWLDGTRLGDDWLDMLPAQKFRWALPLRTGGADLEKVPPQPFARPQYIGVLDIDATAGFEQPAKIHAEEIYRGDSGYAMYSQLSALSQDDAANALRVSVA